MDRPPYSGCNPMLRLLFAGLARALFAAPASAQPAKKPLQLRWYGHSFFQLTTTAATRGVFDPHATPPAGPGVVFAPPATPESGAPPVPADIVVMSHDHNDHNRKEVLANAD